MIVRVVEDFARLAEGCEAAEEEVGRLGMPTMPVLLSLLLIRDLRRWEDECS